MRIVVVIMAVVVVGVVVVRRLVVGIGKRVRWSRCLVLVGRILGSLG